MKFVTKSFLSKKNLGYCHMFFGLRMVSLASLKSNSRGLASFVDLKKWKTSNLSCLIAGPNLLKREEIML